MTTVQVLHIDACPGWRRATENLRAALDGLGRDDVAVEPVRLLTDDDAAGMPFAGSPTILVDGRDLFPTALALSNLACRVYVTDAGLAGSPSLAQIEAALRDRLDAR